MAKNKKNPPVPKLSPENYIRQKARNLPIYECWASPDWEETGTATICVSRIHTNGNITFAMYLVDLYCLGVKESIYNFNLTMTEFRDFLAKVKDDLEIVKVDYVLAHNIVFAAIEYADELGFKPHKNFTSVSQYVLEEDTDDIELMDISCGCDGKPMFIKTELVSNAEAQRVIAQLDRAVGKGNYNVILTEDDDEFIEEEDEDEDLMDEYNLLTPEDKTDLFKKLTCNGLEDISDEDKLKVIALTDSIFLMDLCDEEEVDDICDRWSSDVNMEIDENLYTWESLGLESEREISEEEMDEFDNLDDLIDKQSKKAEKKLEKLRKKWGNIPYLDCVELNYLESINSKHYESKLIEFVPKLMDYPFFKMDLYKHTVAKHIEDGGIIEVIDIDDIFDGRESITAKEMISYLTNKFFGLQVRDNKNELEAMYDLIDDVDLDDTVLDMLKLVITFIRINSLIEDFK